MLRSCLGPFSPARKAGVIDPLLWEMEIKQHNCGDYSVAAVQANKIFEDQCQVISGNFGTFVGVFDGHGGPAAARFVSNRMFSNIQNYLDRPNFSLDVFSRAFKSTDDDFVKHVIKECPTQPEISQSGSCCLVGLISNKTLYVANAGDSKVVLGTSCGRKKIKATQLSTEHNAAHEDVRRELTSLHPDDPHIVVHRNGGWRVKGIIQVSRSIGDLYLKRPEFSNFVYANYGIPLVNEKPILTAEPEVRVHRFTQEDQFLIFASDGLWEILSDQEAAEIVYNHSRNGIARRLILSALQAVAKKRGITYDELKRMERGKRREYHDDISVVVIYLDHGLMAKKPASRVSSSQGTIQRTHAPSDIFAANHGLP